jgi:diguanylate cyclase (GGDEF)-like protein
MGQNTQFETRAGHNKSQAIPMLEFISRIRRVFASSVIGVVVVVFFLVFQPMQAELKKSLTEVFAQVSRTNYYVVENIIERYIEGAKSLSSRTMIKNALGEYKSGQMSLAELRTYTQAKYEDGARAIDYIILAQRIVDDNVIASYQAGDAAFDMPYAAIGKQQGSEIVPQIIIRHDSVYTLMNSPVCLENEVVGWDFLVYDMTKQIEALRSKNVQAYLIDDAAYRQLLDASVKTEHHGEDTVIMKDGLLFWIAPIADMYFVSAQERLTLYKPIRQLADRAVVGGAVVFAGYTLVVYVYIFLYLKREVGSLESSRDAYKEMAYIDHLTGAYSRQFLDVWNESLRSYESKYAIVVIDVDDFKGINDIYGHATGDRVLQQLAAAISRSIRRSDLLARYGGDEFVLVLSDIDTEDAQSLLARLEDRLTISVPGSHSIPIRISYGMSLLVKDADFDELLKQADSEMYEAKRAKKGKHQDGAPVTV